MEFIISVLVMFVVFGWLMKKIFPFLITWFIKRKMKKGGGASFGQFGPFGFYGTQFGQQTDDQQESRRSKDQEGKVTVVTMDQKEKVIEKNMGEYIDFEEEK